MQYFDPELNESYVPYVVETSVGVDRMFLAILTNALQRRKCPTPRAKTAHGAAHSARARAGECAVLPIVRNKEELVEKARACTTT